MPIYKFTVFSNFFQKYFSEKFEKNIFFVFRKFFRKKTVQSVLSYIPRLNEGYLFIKVQFLNEFPQCCSIQTQWLKLTFNQMTISIKCYLNNSSKNLDHGRFPKGNSKKLSVNDKVCGLNTVKLTRWLQTWAFCRKFFCRQIKRQFQNCRQFAGKNGKFFTMYYVL